MSSETEIYDELIQDDSVNPEISLLVKSRTTISDFCGSLRFHPWKIITGVTAFLVLVIVSLIICIVAQNQPISCKSSSQHTMPPYAEQVEVKNSKEYQIQLADLDMWLPRTARAEQWTKSTNDISAYLNLSMTDMKNYTRTQYAVDASSCHNSQLFRVRDYIDHPEYSTTIDIKESTHEHEQACSFPFWPGYDVFDGSFQKCEKDIHRCYTKFSRETRITFANVTTFTTCADLVHLYPYAFKNIPYERLWVPVIRTATEEYWWMGKFVGDMAGTAYEIEITLRYDSLNDLLTEAHPPNYGEWSIRIFTLNEGLTNDWDLDVVADANHLWRSLSDIYGNDDGDC